ncbi:MAG TPA: tetratricopeptide repeat protein [Blastocatellia bacterium]|nr:tetratricopeptide repeat protein [Blastocatellia bacterium]
MKSCPQCDHVETDDALAFCRIDGARLVVVDESASDMRTAVLPRPGSTASTTVLENSERAQTGRWGRIQLFKARILTFVAGRLRQRIGKAVLAAIVALALTGLAHYLLSGKGRAGISSLAVLPFLNVNADQQLDYLSDGMTEMLISNLSQLPIPNVKARSSVFRYKGQDVAPGTVGRDLNVQAVLNGRIAVRGDLLTLSLELADARTENVIWSEQYTRKQSDLVALQSEIAHDVLTKLRMKLVGGEEQKLSKKYTTDPEAYQLYLKGRFYWNKRTLKDLEKALEYFNRAIELDPSYALAYAGRADTYAVLPFYRNGPVREAMPAAREAAMKALSLDPDLAEAHATLGHVFSHECDFAEAEREYKRAIELNPNYATAHQWYGILLFYLGRNEESLAEFQQALEIDPLSLVINLDYAESLFYARRYGDAIAQLKKTLELNTEYAGTYQRFTKYYQANQNYVDAAHSYATYRELMGDRSGAALIRDSLAKDGWHGCLRAMTAKDQLGNLSRYDAVVFLTALGEKEKALAELDKSYGVFGPLLRIEPLLDPLRDDPRFQEILRRAGLS